MKIFKQRKQSFSIRKYTVGVCSVALASLLLGVSSPTLAEGETPTESTTAPATTPSDETSSPESANTTPETTTTVSDTTTGGTSAETPATPDAESANEASAKMEITSANVMITGNSLNVQVVATSGATFTVNSDGHSFTLNEMLQADGTSLYTINVTDSTPHRNSAVLSPVVTLAYDFNGEKNEATFTEANTLDQKLASVEKIERVSKKDTADYTADEIAKIKAFIASVYDQTGYNYSLSVDEENQTITATVDFGTDENFNILRTAMKPYKFSAFTILNVRDDVEVEVARPADVTISNKTIAGSVFVPKNHSSKLIYGTTEYDMKAGFPGQLNLTPTAAPMVYDPSVIFRVTNGVGQTTDFFVDLTDGGKVEPFHIQMDKFFKENYFPEVTKDYDLTSDKDLAELREILGNILKNSPLTSGVSVVKDVPRNYEGPIGYDEKYGVFVQLNEETVLTDGTTVHYKYYVNLADLTKKQPEVKPETPEAKPETPEAKPETPEAKPETPEAKPETPEAKPETPEVKPETPKAKEKQLPYTGTADSTVLSVAGISLLGLAVALKKRKKN